MDIDNVSLLVDLKWPGVVDELSESVQIYSMTIDVSDKNRSQVVADIHHLLHQYWDCHHSIIFFKNKDQYIISFADKDQSHVLSDWFDIDVDNDDIVDRLNIGCLSLEASNDYYNDFVFAVAREYYIYPISFENASYGMMPLDYVTSGLATEFGVYKEDVKALIRNNMRIYEMLYGDDYVAPIYDGVDTQASFQRMAAELERISFELELAAEMEDEPQPSMFDDDAIDDGFVDDDILDEFEDDIDPAIFDDPVLMVKWLEKRQKQLDKNLGEEMHRAGDQQRQETECCEQEHLEAERREQEHLEAERREQERLEAERREQERLEAERREQERLEAERREQERLEAERRKQERLEAERRKQEHLEDMRKKLDELEERHCQMLIQIQNRYSIDIEQVNSELETIARRLLENERRIMSLGFLQFVEKKNLKAEQEMLVSRQTQLSARRNGIENRLMAEVDEENRRYHRCCDDLALLSADWTPPTI